MKNKNTIYVLCNPMQVQYLKPIRWSKLIDYFDELVLIAEYFEEEYSKITDADAEQNNFWSCPLGSSMVFEEDEYRPRVMRKQGLFSYIMDTWNLCNIRNQAALINNMAGAEHKDPIEFFNSL